MNKKRRSVIEDAYNAIETYLLPLQDVLAEEAEAYDNMPDSLRDSERGQISDESISLLEDAIDSLQSTVDTLEQILAL